ncbi:MAG: PorT family protein [Chitinophagaceae bacterium]|nr:PorT family protein [Chitinophagaceae bacterium]
MKNILLLCAFIIHCTAAEAQKVTLSAYMGTVILHAIRPANGIVFDHNPSAPELRIAATCKADVIELRSGLNLTRNEITGKSKSTPTLYDYYNIRFVSVRMPVNVQYNIPLKSHPLSIFGGPYLGYTVYGQNRMYTKGEQSIADFIGINRQKLSWGDKPGQTNPIDFGVQLGAEYEFARLLAINLQYSQSFQNVNVGTKIRFNYQSFHAGIALKLLQPKTTAAYTRR